MNDFPVLRYGAPFANPEKSDELEIDPDELPAAWKPTLKDPYVIVEPSRPTQFLTTARLFLCRLSHDVVDEEVLANLLDDAYLLGRHDERKEKAVIENKSVDEDAFDEDEEDFDEDEDEDDFDEDDEDDEEILPDDPV